MKLRTRLFILVGSLFLVAFIVSYFFENRLVKTNLLRAEENIRNQIISLNESKRQNVEKYLSISLAETEAQLDSLLQKLAEYPIIGLGFAPSVANIERGTWLQTAALMANNKWLDMVQNVNGGQLTSLIIDDLKTSTGIKLEPIDQDVALAVATGDDDTIVGGPYFALRFYVDQYILDRPMVSEAAKNLEQQIPSLWLLFPPEIIAQFPLDAKLPDAMPDENPIISFWHLPGSPTRQQLLDEILSEIKVAKSFLEKNPTMINGSKDWQDRISENSDKLEAGHTPFRTMYPNPNDRELYSDVMNERVYDRFLSISSRLDDLGLIWSLSATYSMGIFGFSPFGPLSPAGIARTIPNGVQGKSMLVGECFFSKPFTKSFGCENTFPDNDRLCLGKKMSAIPVDHLHRFFFANTMRLVDYSDLKSGREGFLTIGKDGSDLLQNLALVTHQTSLFITDGQVLKAFGPDGEEYTNAIIAQLPIKQMLSEKSGIFNFDGTDYFFLHMTPFPNADFHFITYNNKDKEFALVDSLDQSAVELIATIGLNMRIVALIGIVIVLLLLSDLAQRITRPITLLANAAKSVGQGELEEINLPKIEKTRNDEVSQLYESFHEMIQGLKEKEKVRGVLNKVVSREIAEEILKGNVQLGGEEKEVTVLFADVRSFTHITEKMMPKDVVTMLNTCMTRISRCIDQHNGVIDKFVGDEVMALFGAPVQKEDSPLRAVLSAISMVESLQNWNKERLSHGEQPIEMGFGIHTGKVLAGNMGAENRLNYTVLGANVNLASRLCSAAKPMEILISKNTYESPHVKNNIAVEEMPPIELKGFTLPITVYRVLGHLNHS